MVFIIKFNIVNLTEKLFHFDGRYCIINKLYVEWKINKYELIKNYLLLYYYILLLINIFIINEYRRICIFF